MDRIIAVVVALSFTSIAACNRNRTPEDEIRAAIHGIRDAARAGDVRDFGEYLSASYSDEEGNDRETAIGLFRVYIGRCWRSGLPRQHRLDRVARRYDRRVGGRRRHRGRADPRVRRRGLSLRAGLGCLRTATGGSSTRSGSARHQATFCSELRSLSCASFARCPRELRSLSSRASLAVLRELCSLSSRALLAVLASFARCPRELCSLSCASFARCCLQQGARRAPGQRPSAARDSSRSARATRSTRAAARQSTSPPSRYR